MEQNGQTFDYLLVANLTSGTTESNKSYQRDSLLTLELIDLNTGRSEKELAQFRKAYDSSTAGSWSY